MRTSLALRHTLLAAYNAALGAGARAIGYTAPQPAAPEDAANGTKLYEFALADPPLVLPAAGGQIAFAPVPDTVAVGNGVLGYLRLVTAGNVVVADLSAAELGNPGAVSIGTAMKLNSLALNLAAGS